VGRREYPVPLRFEHVAEQILHPGVILDKENAVQRGTAVGGGINSSMVQWAPVSTLGVPVA
jgi:hypothetical protein